MFIHGSSCRLPNLLCPVTTHCGVCTARTAECFKDIHELDYRHVVEKKLNKGKYPYNIGLILLQKSIVCCLVIMFSKHPFNVLSDGFLTILV